VGHALGMDAVIQGPGYVLRLGDSRELLAKLKPNSIDALVCDPPAGISFMGKEWDHDHGGRDGWIKAFASLFALTLATMKPGAHGLVWALPRTSHWTATALEDAGFELRDVVMHLFGTGFPKSLNVAKATEDARFDGWGTALKPAAEHWILVRKPLIGTVAENMLEYGTGGLNIDASRILGQRPATTRGAGGQNGRYESLRAQGRIEDNGAGRFPSHLILDEEAAATLDAQSGVLTSGQSAGFIGEVSKSAALGDKRAMIRPETIVGDRGGASRFFYCAKPGRKERDLGCDDLPPRTGGEATDREDGSAGVQNPRAGAGRTGGARNVHPTVKSIELMKYLIRLITPTGGIVLDPFMGSGSTGCAAVSSGFKFVGIEQESEYFEIAKRRIAAAKGTP
jgi:hypothetical protein